VNRVSKSTTVGIVLFVCVLANAGLMLRNDSELMGLHQPAFDARDAQSTLQDVQVQLLSAETAQRGYLLTGQSGFLKSYSNSVDALGAASAKLDKELGSLPQEKQRLAELHQAITQKLTAMADTVSDFSAKRRLETSAQLRAGAGESRTDEIRARLNEMADRQIAASRDTIGEQARAEASAQDRSRLIFAFSCLVNLGLLFIFAMLVRRTRSKHAQAEQQALEQSEGLVSLLTEAARRNKQIFELTELSQYLQSSADLDEATRLLSIYLPVILEAADGAVYLITESRTHLQLAGSWGNTRYRRTVTLDECWALRKGYIHRQPREHGPQSCRHLDEYRATPGAICIPLASQGEQLGLLFMHRDNAHQEVELNDRYLHAAVEQISLAIGNLKLRESLRQQSIHDALTGLYNRRFLEESLQREVARFERQRMDDPNASLALLMLDVDHFKLFNDRFGHQTGDLVLKEVARVLRERVRESDLVARFGGEEFSVVLPDIDRAGAVALAEQLRHAVEHISLSTGTHEVASVSISIGVTVLTQPGTSSPADLLRAADRALYEAKRRGRNQVSIAARLSDGLELPFAESAAIGVQAAPERETVARDWSHD